MEKLTNFIYIISAILILATGIQSQQRADVTPSQTIVRVGQNVSLLCRFGQPLLYCRFELPNKSVKVLSPQWNNDNSYAYYGEGYEVGQCGITINNIRPEHNGNFHCSLGLTTGDEVAGDIQVIVAQPPIRPEIEYPQNAGEYHEINTEFRAMCVSRDGRPAANLSWYLENERLTNNNVLPEIIETKPDGDPNTTLFTAKLEVSRILRAEDDGKTLTCRAEHIAIDRGFEDVKTQLIVKYAPQPLSPIHLFGLKLAQTATVSVIIRSNPRPRTKWIVSGETIEQGKRNDRFEAAEPYDLGGGLFNVTLIITDLTLEDTTKQYTLSANNQLGVRDYIVKISSADAEPETSMGIGAVVGIAVGCVIILIIIVLVVVARITGRWCFAGGSHRTDGGIDSEAQVANYDDNDKDHEEYHPQENGGHPNATDVTDEVKHEPLTNGNGKTEIKTNTSV